MRKRTIKYTADTIFWYIMYLLPLIYGFICMYSMLRNESFLAEWFSIKVVGNNLDSAVQELMNIMATPFNEAVSYSNPIFLSLMELFGDDGMVTFFDPLLGVNIIIIVSYFVSVYLLHLAVDFLLFIPRLCHKWMNAFTRSEE